MNKQIFVLKCNPNDENRVQYFNRRMNKEKPISFVYKLTHELLD